MVRSTQNAALRDILMLKLVSYYEDKYKLSRMDQQPTTARTTEPLALERLFGESDNPRNINKKRNIRRITAAKRTIARRRPSDKPKKSSESPWVG